MLQILYEDNHLIAVNKPAGLLTQPAEEGRESLEEQVKAWIKETYKKPGNVFLGVVHRLDKPVSGIVLFAKTSKALARLNDQIRAKRMKKVYFAIVEGCMSEDEGVLEHFLRHDDHRAYVSDSKDVEAKPAKLRYRVLKVSEQTSEVEIELETGRYHQIRAQCAAVGCPIVGDTKYGSRLSFEAGAIALHHGKLTFEHPVTHEIVCIQTKLDGTVVARVR